MKLYLNVLESSTEGISVETMEHAIEEIKKPGVVQEFLEGLVPDVLAFLFQLVVAAVVYAVGVRLIKLVRKLIRKGMERRGADQGVKQFLDSLVKALGYFLLIMIILSFFGVATTSVMALVGSAGLTIGLALQGSLSNFAGGVLILMLKPFRVGDYIVEDTHGNEGEVAEVSLFYTKLKTVDHKIIVIPNGTLANSSLTNVTHSDKRRVDLTIGVSYEADLKKAKEVITQVLREAPARLEDEELQVVVSELGASSVDISARIWVPTEQYWSTRFALLERIKLALDENGIGIPYPQMDVHVKQE